MILLPFVGIDRTHKRFDIIHWHNVVRVQHSKLIHTEKSILSNKQIQVGCRRLDLCIQYIYIL